MFEVGKSKALGLALALVIATAGLAACGSDDEGAAAAEGISPDTADELARLSDEVAAELEAGDTCSAAARADDLYAAVSEARLPSEVRAEAEAGAEQLVNEVNCEPEPETTTEEDGEEHKEDKEEEEGKEEEGSGESGPGSSGPPGQEEDFVPPGQAKIKGGI